MSRKSTEDHHAIEREILERLGMTGVKAAYESWGCQFTKTKPTSSGWLECRVIGEQDGNPSAAVGVAGDVIGRYSNRKADTNVSFWDSAITYGGLADFQAAKKHFAEQVGVELSAKIEKPFLREVAWIDSIAARWATKMDGVGTEVLQPTGAVMAKRGSLRVIAWPVWGVGHHPVGHYYRNILPGQPIKNRDVKHKQLLTPGCSPCGWINADGLSRLLEGQVSRCLWVEGVPDMLAAETYRVREGIPDDLLILTSSHGAMTVPPNEVLSLIEDVPTWVIGDADKDGQAGVERKLHHLKHFCPAETWRLPYDVEPKHGKDLRDWLTDGHTLAELLDDLPNPEPRDASLPPASASQPKPESKGTARSDVDKLLESLDLHVAGRTEDGHLILWNGGYARWETVRNVDRFGFDSFCSMVGSRANDHIVPKAIEDDQRLPWSIARREIALRSAENTVAIDNRFGPGVWQARDENGHRIEGELAIVTREWAAIWDGSILTRLQAPFYRGMVLEIGTGDQWIQFEQLQQLLDQAADRQWVEGRFMDCTQMFASWRWVAQGEDPELVTALVVATFVQDVLEWCPQVVVVGESNTGKSYLLIALSSVFTSLCLKCSAHSTDAGLRQAIGNSCRPTLLDEWDSSKHRGQLLLMMRTASRGDARLVGTSYQKAQRSELKQMFWAAGITSGLTDQADQNRFIQIQLLPPKRGDEGKLQLRKPADLLSLGHELLAIGIRYGAEIAERARQIRESAPRDGTDSRILESYSVPAGVFAACLGLKASEAQEGLSSLLTSSGDQEVQSDQDALMDAILSQVVDAGGSLRKQSIAQLIRLAHVDQSEDAEKALVREGIAIDYDDDGEHLIAFGYRIIQDQLMKSTRWADKTINELLLRISTARLVKKKRFAGRRLTWVAIEFEHFNAVYGAGGQRNLL